MSPFKERRGIMNSDTPAMYQYFVNAIPTTYTDIKKNVTNTYQYLIHFYFYFPQISNSTSISSLSGKEQWLTTRITETHHIRPLQEMSSLMPGIYFVYEFSPLRSGIKETHLPLFELLTSLCAILGGVFTMMGLIDGIMYSVGKKAERRSKSMESELTQRAVSKSD